MSECCGMDSFFGLCLLRTLICGNISGSLSPATLGLEALTVMSGGGGSKSAFLHLKTEMLMDGMCLIHWKNVTIPHPVSVLAGRELMGPGDPSVKSGCQYFKSTFRSLIGKVRFPTWGRLSTLQKAP